MLQALGQHQPHPDKPALLLSCSPLMSECLVYSDLKLRLARMWGSHVSKVVIAALGSMSAKLKSYLIQVEIDYHISILHKSAVLGTVHTLGKVLSI